ncbi:hypothetical protein EYF80_054318 [Liparis tanakae]|uniref:Uncharacterized protein n=1 Tax=Liparis tanakae TaxID=230148 RepID=A0A4Z2F304_9TELE|nr:hypothetical protein EYF80_054318 [Liparis tanakae]
MKHQKRFTPREVERGRGIRGHNLTFDLTPSDPLTLCCPLLAGLCVDSPVSGSVARTTMTEVPMPAVSRRPSRLYCCWVNAGVSSLASST